MRSFVIYTPHQILSKWIIIQWIGACTINRETRGAYRVLWGKCEGKRPRRRFRYRWWDNIEMELPEMGWGAWSMLV
jgi:hypothetical protein